MHMGSRLVSAGCRLGCRRVFRWVVVVVFLLRGSRRGLPIRRCRLVVRAVVCFYWSRLVLAVVDTWRPCCAPLPNDIIPEIGGMWREEKASGANKCLSRREG